MPPQTQIAADDASASTAGLIGGDDRRCSPEAQPLSVDGRPRSPSSSASFEEGEGGEVRRRRCSPYLPASVPSFEGSLRLACLSHLCFLLASAFYVRLSFADLAWAQTTRAYDVPSEVLEEDDDEIWQGWTSSIANGSDIEEMRDDYTVQSKMYYTLGAAFFALVGVLDWMRYCDLLNVVMILAGLAGVASGLADTSNKAAIWDAISVHLYLLEGCNLMRRKHDYEGMGCFRMGDLCFLAGSILDVIGSYLGLAGFGDLLWAVYTDVTACLLWLACSLIGIGAEVYYLRKRRSCGACGCVRCY